MLKKFFMSASYLFTKPDERDDRHRVFSGRRTAAVTAAATLTAVTVAFNTIYINKAREVTLEILFGNVVQQVDTPGLISLPGWNAIP